MALPQLTASVFCAWLVYRGVRIWRRPANPIELVPGPVPESWFEGDVKNVVSPDGLPWHAAMERTYGAVAKVKMFFGINQLYLFDPKALYHILVKDQDVYEENFLFRITFLRVFGEGLLSTLGDHHRRQRKLLNPAFSASHLKELLPVFLNISHQVRDTLTKKVARGEDVVDMLGWATRATLETIGQSGFGHSFDSLTDEAIPHPFVVAARDFAPTLNQFTMSRFLVFPLVYDMGPAWLRRWIVNILPWPKLHKMRDIVDTMHNTSVGIFEAKKRALENGEPPIEGNPWDGKDIISLLLKANMSASESDRLPDHELLAQMNTIAFAGMDTTSNTISRALYTLAKHKDIQRELRAEIRQARSQGGELGYEELDQLPLLDAVCKETLRLYPATPFMLRVARKEIVLPVSKPVTLTNGEVVDQIHVPKDTDVILSLVGCNRNPDIWGSDASEWRPARWLSPLSQDVLSSPIPGVYSHLMTFLGGGRACIGFKFAIIEIKALLSILLETLEFSVVEDVAVTWEFNGAVQPALKEDGVKPGQRKLELPLKISLAS